MQRSSATRSTFASLACAVWALGCSSGVSTQARHSVTPAQPVPVAPTATTAPTAAPGQPVAAKPRPPGLRLNDTARPLGYQIDLTLLPQKEDFRGEVEIELEVLEATEVLWLNATELAIDRAHILIGDRQVTARVIEGGEDHVGFAIDRRMEPGPVTLRASYRGVLPSHEEGGLFRRKEGDFWYIYSQFEPFDARRAFPSFDDPRFKVPYQVTLRVDKDHHALTNTPVESKSELPDGMKAVRFKPTQPLPSYLVAIAVGPFDIVDAGTAGRKNTPIRIITPRGKAAGAKFARQATGPILAILEDYFDRPYPYEKLDQIAVPSFLGAMENPGLVTYHQELLLSEPDEDTLWRQRGFAGTCAHELAHMWFGDLVTMKWWDDLWLNEAFATWMAAKTIHRWKPEWEKDVDMVKSAGWAMSSDSLATARKIRQPIASKHDIDNAFDNITYGKGAAVLRMFESWIGEEKFRQGINSYIAKHALGNAEAGDFLAALGEVSDGKVTEAFTTFIDQPGVPLLRTELQCSGGARPRLSLSQERYLPAGSTGDRTKTWQIPVCVEYDAGTSTGRSCTLMTTARAEIELEAATRCPRWVLPNSDMAGYYHVEYSGDMLSQLLDKSGNKLTVAERIGIISDMDAMTEAGTLSRSEALAWVPRLHKSRNRHIAASTVNLAKVPKEYLPGELEANYARFVRKMYSRRAHQLGWQVGKNEADSTRLLRPRLLLLVAQKGQDTKLIAQADTLVRRWLDDRKAIHPDLVYAALSVAGKRGDLELWQRFYQQARTTTDSKERRRLLYGMSRFEDPAIVKKNLALLASDEFKLLDSSVLMWGALWNHKTRGMAFEFIVKNFDSLVARAPRFAASGLGYTAAAFCSVDEAKRAEELLRPRIDKVQGGPRALDQGLEQARLCAARKDREMASVAEFLKKY
ncbi:MAG: M1 family metallopeptidase [Proteobacteria bacterium]|nr:M1 family metallopeptidase [Pseudomonadota bacterium]